MGAVRVSESEFTTIKQLLEKGYDGIKVSEIVGRARGVVSRVNTSSSYQEYQKRGKGIHKKVAKQEQLPLDAPKKTTLDMREDLLIKYNELYSTLIAYRIRNVNNPGKWRAHNMAIERLEESRLWLKESF